MPRDALTFTGIVLRGNGVYVSLCLELDVASQGRTVQAAKDALCEAITLYLETAFENNLPYIRPVPPAENPMLTEPEKVVETFPVKVDLAVRVHA